MAGPCTSRDLPYRSQDRTCVNMEVFRLRSKTSLPCFPHFANTRDCTCTGVKPCSTLQVGHSPNSSGANLWNNYEHSKMESSFMRFRPARHRLGLTHFLISSASGICWKSMPRVLYD